MVESEEELKTLLIKMKEESAESEKAGLTLNIRKTKIVASSPITSWQIEAKKKWKQWQTLFLVRIRDFHIKNCWFFNPIHKDSEDKKLDQNW